MDIGPDIFGRLAVFDASDRFVDYLGAGPDADVDLDRGWPARPGWPNDLSAEGRATPPAAGPGGFTTPHSLAVDARGNLYVSGPGGVWILSPEGRHLGMIRPPELPANFAWGDEEGQTLYMTARTGLYRIRLNVAGTGFPVAAR